MTTSKLCEDSVFGNSVSALCLQNLWFILMKKSATFDYVVEVFSHGNISLFWRILNWSANESKTLALSDQSLQGRVLQVSP